MFNAESSSLNVQNFDENIVTIITMTPEEVVAEWARENKINAGTVEKLFEEGFTSLEALKLLDEEDLSKSKIPRGQKKLILSCVRALNGGTTLGSEVEHQTGDATRVTQTNATYEVRAQSTERAQTSNQSTTLGVSHDQENGGAQCTQSTTDSYVQGLLNQLLRGQKQAQNGLAGDLSAIQTPGINGSSGSLWQAARTLHRHLLTILGRIRKSTCPRPLTVSQPLLIMTSWISLAGAWKKKLL